MFDYQLATKIQVPYWILEISVLILRIVMTNCYKKVKYFVIVQLIGD